MKQHYKRIRQVIHSITHPLHVRACERMINNFRYNFRTQIYSKTLTTKLFKTLELIENKF